MLSNYSIELESENIYYEKTKKYFKEVMSSYISGNYRSAIVVLWTVTIYDLMLKLEELHTLYNDTTAKGILNKIEETQKASPKNPEWESQLILKIESDMDMFQSHEIVHIQSLQKLRHISAHPTIDHHSLSLYQPNKETVRATIRNLLEIVLTRPPLASKKILLNFLQDLADKKELLTSKENLERYLDATYFSRTPMIVKEYIFKHLWKLTYSVENKECDENRFINHSTIIILFKKYNSELTEIMNSDIEYYTKKINISSKTISLNYILVFLGTYISVFHLFPKAFQDLLKTAIEKDYSFQIVSFFLYQKEEEYLQFFLDNYNSDALLKDPSRNKYIVKNLEKENANKIVNKFIETYTNSTSYNVADSRFSNLIEPILEYISKENMEILLEGIKNNNQTYERSKAEEDHKLLEQRCLELNITYK